MKLPSISILSLTLNPDLQLFKKSLDSINNQNYPQDKIEHIIADGGSYNPTIVLAKKFNCRVISKKDYRENSEGRRSFAVMAAKHDIILWLEPDNILPEPNCLIELIRPLLEDESIFSSFTLHYHYNRKMSLLNRYCALFGVSDPVVYYLKKAEKEAWLTNHYLRGKVKYRKKDYDVVEFDENTLPTVGDNGSVVWRKILLKAKILPNFYFHTDVFVDLLKMGFNHYAVVKSTSIENYVDNHLSHLVKRRTYYFLRDSTLQIIKNRRYTVFNIRSGPDRINLFKFIFFTLTFIQPLLLSLKGFIKKRDIAWFIHLVISWLFLIHYFKAILIIKFKPDDKN